MSFASPLKLRLALSCGVLICVGCSDDPFPLAPVSGKVSLNGKPLADARICFSPTSKQEDGSAGQASQGITDSQGHFELVAVDGCKGAVVGSHRIIISTFKTERSGKILRHETLPRRFNAASKLSYVVAVGGTKDAEFQLEAKDLLRTPRNEQAMDLEAFE